MIIGYLQSQQQQYLRIEVPPLEELKQGLILDIVLLFLFIKNAFGGDNNFKTSDTYFGIKKCNTHAVDAYVLANL